MWTDILLKVLLNLVLILIIIQDFKTRTIIWWSPLVLFVISLSIHYRYFEGFNFPYILTNLGFIFVQLLGLTLYFSWKKRKWVNIMIDFFGLGDILFLIPLCFIFTPINFILFFIISLLFILILSLIYQLKIKDKSNFTIPFAGMMAISLMINQFITKNTFDDFSILNQFINY